MAVIEVDVSKRTNFLDLGIQGEKNAHTFEFDISSWIQEIGAGGTASLDLQRPGEAESYMVGLTVVDGIASWTVSDVDNAKAGSGKAQLVYSATAEEVEKKVKTAIYATNVNRALDEQQGDVPDPYESYIDTARAIYSETAEKAIEAAQHEEAAVTAQHAAEVAHEAAEAAADRAENVFTIAGNASFAVNPDGSVNLIFTESEE